MRDHPEDELRAPSWKDAVEQTLLVAVGIASFATWIVVLGAAARVG